MNTSHFSTLRCGLWLMVATLLSACAPDGDIREWRQFSHNGETRHYHLFVPHGALQQPEPLALVINLHGATPAPAFSPTFGSFFQQVITGMPNHAAKHHYIVAHPQSRHHDGVQYWDGSDNVDTDFINDLVDSLMTTLPVDPNRVFLSGFSSGGMLAWKLACEYSDRYAAIAPVAANRRSASDCPTARAVPVIAFHGEQDATVSFDSGEQAMQDWVTQHQCSQPDIVFAQDDTRCQHWSSCTGNSEMRFCRSDTAGHTWPAGPGSFLISAAGFGETSYTLDATEQIWAFFQATRPANPAQQKVTQASADQSIQKSDWH